ncbi:hypothetical protein FHS03_004815 [Massilia violacea]|uniref:Core-binding (CB) domain-containing protein n=1 Tax=Pseudoduganella violacea TaxID=1715466 RepID=A0A7W5BEM5_9BURK|nr:hypothetical protein [Pseudoduganella violacea]
MGQHIRLTSREIAYFTYLTDIEPVGIKTLDDLDAYIRRCKRHYWGHSPQTRQLHRLIDEALASCMASIQASA